MLCIKNTLIALVIGLLVGFAAGFYVKGKFVKAEIVSAIEQERKENGRAIADMQAKETTLWNQIERSRENAESVQDAVRRKGVRVVNKAHPAGLPGPALCDANSGADLVLDSHTVGMLNAARANRPAYPAARINDQGKAAAGPAGVGDRH